MSRKLQIPSFLNFLTELKGFVVSKRSRTPVELTMKLGETYSQNQRLEAGS